jgi:hypothetical protein
MFSYYLIEKTNIYAPTKFIYDFKGGSKIKSQRGESTYRLNSNIKFIPQLPTKEVFSILEKTVFGEGDKLRVIYDSDLHRFTKKHLLSETRDDTYRFKVIHTPSQVVWSSRPHKNQGKVKVLIPLTTYFESIATDTCGNTQGMGYVLCESREEAERIKDLLLTPLYRFIANVTRWSNFNVPLVMQSLPLYPYSKPIDEETMYASFRLNKKEIELIKSSLHPLAKEKSKPSEVEVDDEPYPQLAFNLGVA